MIGKIIDEKYHVIEEKGEGGFGKVYRVKENDEEFALKTCTSSDLADIKRFGREVRLMESINNENVIKVLHYNLEYKPPYFVMPLAKLSLADLLPKLEGKEIITDFHTLITP